MTLPSLLNQTLFHGTSVDIGAHVIPGKEKGYSNWDEHGDDQAYATSAERTAWRFANSSYMHRRDDQRENGRPRVYTVEPHPQTEMGAFHAASPKHFGAMEDLQEYVAPSFPVTGRLDIKAGHQGTFPDINWNQHSNTLSDVNHPEDLDIERGHMPTGRKEDIDRWTTSADRARRIDDAARRPKIADPAQFGDVPKETGPGLFGVTTFQAEGRTHAAFWDGGKRLDTYPSRNHRFVEGDQ